MKRVEPAEAGSRPVFRPPSAGEVVADRIFHAGAHAAGVVVVGLLFGIVAKIGLGAWPAVRQLGLGFLGSAVWDPGRGEFGVLAEIWGTLYSSCLALAIASVLGVAVAIFLTQGFLDDRLAAVFRTAIEMLAAIPSVVFGLWGITVVIPALRPVAAALHAHLGWLPPFATAFSGPSLAPGVVVLAIMVLPTVAAISQDALRRVPDRTREAAFGLGATRSEAITRVMLPAAASGILASLVLGFGRALGETMALAMLIGNSGRISWSVFAPANTLASLLASQFPEASGTETAALMYAATVLLAISLGVNVVGTLVMACNRKAG